MQNKVVQFILDFGPQAHIGQAERNQIVVCSWYSDSIEI